MKQSPNAVKLSRFRSLLKSVKAEKLDTDNPIFHKSLEWLRAFPEELSKKEKDELRTLVLDTFSLQEADLLKYVPLQILESLSSTKPEGEDPLEIELDLWERIPPHGFFHQYCEYTSKSESPLAFHLFSSMCIAGSVIGRRCWIDMGYYKIFPNLSVVLIAPTGICRKTTGTNIAVGLLQKLGITKVYSEKMTPEALVDAMKESSTGLLYAPEFSVFLNKQKYNDGMVPLLTRLLDNPDIWDSATIGRGKTVLRDVALSMLGASTLDWFITATPQDVMDAGFINRLLLVIQEDTPREEAIPDPPGDDEAKRLLIRLAAFKEAEGALSLTNGALRHWKEWYHHQREITKAAETDTMTNYTQRRPDRVLKVAMLLHLSEHHTTSICKSCLEAAIDLMMWTERFIPSTVKKMFQTQAGEESQFVLKLIEKCGGMVDHSTLVRRAQYKMSAQQLKAVVQSLKEGRQIREIHDATAHFYVLQGGKDE